MFAFKPFSFTKHEPCSEQHPKARSGHRIVCDEAHMYSYGGFNPSVTEYNWNLLQDIYWETTKPLFRELWKFNLVTQEWIRNSNQSKLPYELASNAVILKGDTLMVYGGTGFPFGARSSNQLYVGNIKEGSMSAISAKGDLPDPRYGQAVICHGPYLYTVGGTTGYEYTCDIHRFKFTTNTWESVYICTGKDPCEPAGRYRHEVAFDGRKIYILGGGTGHEAFGFDEIPAFDIETNRWETLTTTGDKEYDSLPAARRCHGAVQYEEKSIGTTFVVISGGYNGTQIFNDVWMLNLKTLEWICLWQCFLPCPVYFHSTALTPFGCMYTFGGIIKQGEEVERTDAVHSVWLKIPKLSEISWLALNYYHPEVKSLNIKELLTIGVPQRFARRTN